MAGVLDYYNQWLSNIQKKIDDSVRVDKLKISCLKATKKIRKEIAEDYSDGLPRGFRYQSTLNATQYNQTHTNETIDDENRKITVLTESYVDGGSFNPPRSKAQQWVNRHPEIPISKSPNIYILDLIMDDGIVGLPAYFKYVNPPRPNPYFQQASMGLEAFYDTSGRWKEFEKLVKGNF